MSKITDFTNKAMTLVNENGHEYLIQFNGLKYKVTCKSKQLNDVQNSMLENKHTSIIATDDDGVMFVVENEPTHT